MYSWRAVSADDVPGNLHGLNALHGDVSLHLLASSYGDHLSLTCLC